MIDDILNEVKERVDTLPLLPDDFTEAATAYLIAAEKVAKASQEAATLEESFKHTLEAVALQIQFLMFIKQRELI